MPNSDRLLDLNQKPNPANPGNKTPPRLQKRQKATSTPSRPEPMAMDTMTPVPALLPFTILKRQSVKNKWSFSNLVFHAFSCPRRSTISTTDTEWHGDVFAQDKEITSTRLLVNNIRGLHLAGRCGIDMALYDHSSLKDNIFAISKHCLDTSKLQIKHSLQENLPREFPGKATLQFDSSANPLINNYKPGGTGIIARVNIIRQLEPKRRGGNPLGQWSFLTFCRKNLIPIYSVYQVC